MSDSSIPDKPSQTALSLSGDLQDPNGQAYDDTQLVNIIIGGIAEVTLGGTIQSMRRHLAKLDRATLQSVARQMFPDE